MQQTHYLICIRPQYSFYCFPADSGIIRIVSCRSHYTLASLKHITQLRYFPIQ